jgi:hypothetical protein
LKRQPGAAGAGSRMEREQPFEITNCDLKGWSRRLDSGEPQPLACSSRQLPRTSERCSEWRCALPMRMHSVSRTEHRPAACAPSGHSVCFRLGWKRSATPLGAQTWRSMFHTCRMRQAGSLCSPVLAIGHRKFTIENQKARVAKFADAPDLGFQNQRFQSIAFRFRRDRFRDRKMRFFTK